VHPDLLWVFPLPKPKSGDLEGDDVFVALAEAIEERLDKGGVWTRAALTDAIYRGMMKELVKRSTFSPSMAARKVIVIADAHRMVSQEGSDEAANSFLKVLEEPSKSTTIILTSSDASSLLPTIRSRVVPLRVHSPSAADRQELRALGVLDEGASDAAAAAAQLLEAARGDEAARYRVAFRQGSSGARGNFTAALDALTALLHEQAQDAARNARNESAAGFARAIAVVEETRRVARQNANPQLLMANLLMDIAPLLS
jgi:DNA polymerase-3 subunit delta'